MYAVSSDFLAAISSNSKTSRITGVITTKTGEVKTVADKDILSGSLSIENSCVPSTYFNLGAVYSAVMSCKFMSDNITVSSIKGASISLSYILTTGEGIEESVPLGVFMVSEAVSGLGLTSVSCFDNMLAFNKEVTSLVSGSPMEIVKWCCTECGVVLGMTDAYILSLCNSDIALSRYDKDGIKTYRDILGYIAQLSGGFATMTRDNKLVIKDFDYQYKIGQTPYNIPYSQVYSRELDTDGAKINSVSITLPDGEYIKKDLVLFPTGSPLVLETNPLLVLGTVDKKNTAIANIFSTVAGKTVYKASVKFPGNPALDVGDVVTISELGVSFYITSISWTLRGDTVVDCNELSEVTVSSSTDRSSSILLGGSGGTGESMNMAIKAVNIKDISLGVSESKLASLSFMANSDTVPIVSIGVVVNVTTAGTVTINTKYDYVEVKPHYKQTLPLGYHTLSLPYALDVSEQSTPHNLAIRISSLDCKGLIAEGDVVVSVIGSGIESKDVVWDGKIIVDEAFTRIALDKSNLAVTNMNGVITSKLV